MKSLSEFLDAKPLYYDEIDYGRMPRAYRRIESRLKLPKIVHVVGTNGKGTTGRFLANALYRSGYDVGHYTSPHILRFNERIWHNGSDVSDETLESAHRELTGLLDEATADALSYFEYTTLLAVLIYRDCDYAVLEAGLGGEFDATNVFPKVLSVFTPIGIDHQAFLGDTVESVALTKLRSMGPKAVIGLQPFESVYGYFDETAASLGTEGYRAGELLDKSDVDRAQTIAEHLSLPEYLRQNLLLAMAAAKALGVEIGPESFDNAPLFGRLSRIGDRVTLDVGHNVLAAEAICKALAPKKTVLVYNSFRDKDYEAIIRTLKPVIERVEIIEVEDVRAELRPALEAALERAGVPYRSFEGVGTEDEYLVFGSFSVAEAFLKVYRAR